MCCVPQCAPCIAVVFEELNTVCVPSSGVCHTPCLRHESTLIMEPASYPEAPTHTSHPGKQHSTLTFGFFWSRGIKFFSCDVTAESETLVPLGVRLPAAPTEVWPCREPNTATLSQGLEGPYWIPEVANLTRWGEGGLLIR